MGRLTTALSIVCLALLAVASAADASGWTLRPVPSPPFRNGRPTGLSCQSASSCEAVGTFTNPYGSPAPYAAYWNGHVWALQAISDPASATSPGGAFIGGVSCSAASACTAVGSDSAGPGMFAVRWSGSTWAAQSISPPSGDTAGSLSAVACPTSTSCFAVGGAGTSGDAPLVETWNGSAWTGQALALPAGSSNARLTDIACRSATACVAVGWSSNDTAQHVLVERWNGMNWRIQASVNPATGSDPQLAGVACSAANACTAVGYYETSDTSDVYVAFAERWDGSSWTLQTIPNPTGVTNLIPTSVSCPTASSCTATGEAGQLSTEKPFAASWNGTAWTTTTLPLPPGGKTGGLQSVWCSSGTSCLAVGSAGFQPSLTETLSGSTWTAAPAITPAGGTNNFLTSVSCATTSACVAVGGYGPASGSGATESPLAESWNGAKWTAQTPPLPTGYTYDWLLSVACPSSGECMAVGVAESFSNSSFTQTAFSELWNGASWTAETLPEASGASSTPAVGAVTCRSVSNCTAVGDESASTAATRPIVEQWNGSAWSARFINTLSGAHDTTLNAISCGAASDCEAVGDYQDSTGNRYPLAEHLNGSTWTASAAAAPAGSTSSSLGAVYCTSASTCTAVGYLEPSSGQQQSSGELTLAEQWNGTAWTVQNSQDPTGGIDDFLSDVDCTATNSCTAVGSSSSFGGSSETLAESWNGASWALQSAPALSDWEFAGLTGIACPTGGCVTVGSVGFGNGLSYSVAATSSS